MQENISFIPIQNDIIVNIDVFAIMLGAGSSLLNIEIGNGFQIQEIPLRECMFENKILMGDGNINLKYLSSQITNSEVPLKKPNFICVIKKDSFVSPQPFQDSVTYIGTQPLFFAKAEKYKNEQFQYLSDLLSKFVLYKEGDIGFYEIFFRFSGNYPLGKNTYESTICIGDANTICGNKYQVEENEVGNLIDFLQEHNTAFELLKTVIDNFSYSLKLFYDAKAFELLVTVLEVLFLSKNQKCKKEVLAKRVAVFLGSDSISIRNIYDEIKGFYKYRSDSVHEAEDIEITKQRLLKLREYSRMSIKKYFSVIETDFLTNTNVSFDTVKDSLIRELKSDVAVEIANGILP